MWIAGVSGPDFGRILLMGCGCGKKASEPVKPSEAQRQRQAMCYGCEHAERESLTVLSCEGLPIAHRVVGGMCPLNRFPDRENIVRWLGVRWYGVPMPIRLWAWATHPKHPRPGTFSGCGCVKVLKDAATRAWGAITHSDHTQVQ